MKNDVLTRSAAARLLLAYYKRDTYCDDFARDVRDHFGFSNPDEDEDEMGTDFEYVHAALDEAMNEPPVADIEVLLYALQVESLEQLHAYVAAGRKVFERGPVLVV